MRSQQVNIFKIIKYLLPILYAKRKWNNVNEEQHTVMLEYYV